MKIVVCHNLYEPYERGGAERVVKDLIAAQQAAGHELVLITTRPRGRQLAPATASAPEKELKIYRLASFFYKLSAWPVFFRPLWHLANLLAINKYRKIKNILRREKPDLVITHNLMGLGLMLPQAVRSLNIRHEHWLHDIQLLHPSGLMILGQENKIISFSARSYQFLSRRLIGSPAKIISPSRWLLREHEKRKFFPNSSREISTQQPPPDPKTRADKSWAGDSPAGNNFLFVGQIEDHKGIFFLIKTFKRLPESNLKLLIIGDGSQLAAAKQAAGQDERIVFKGRQTSAAVKAAMLSADCLVVPSLCYENFPTVIKEAQATGLPVLAAASGGILEMISTSDRLFKPGDEEDLLAKLKDGQKK